MKKLLIKPCTEFLSDDIGYTAHYLNDKQIVRKIIEASNVIASASIRAEEKRGKQIFSDIDLYGEENWDE